MSIELIKNRLKGYLNQHFPDSDLNVQFGEINEKISEDINLKLYPKVNYEEQKEFALKNPQKYLMRFLTQIKKCSFW